VSPGGTPSVLVTGAGGPLGANVTRSLRRAPESLRIVGTDANRWHLPLSLCDTTYLIPPAREREGYAAALAEIAAREQVGALVPTHPVEVRAVCELRDRGLLAGVGTALPDTAVVELADDKAASQERLARAGVPVPRTALLGGPGDLARAWEEFAGGGRPVWVRGTGAPGLGIGGAALPCRDVGVARAWVEHHAGWGRMAASEYLPGANLTWMGAFDRGALLAAGTRERLEYVLPHVSPSGVTGAPAVTRTVDRPEVAAIGERAVRGLDPAPHGAYFVDLKEDEGGQARVTEVNAGRCGTTVELYSAAGCNFPWLLVRLARGEHPAPLADPNQAVESGLYWVRTLDCGPVLVRGEEGFAGFPTAGPVKR
jgi:carbamoyl-phosphate synthase large subunit